MLDTNHIFYVCIARGPVILADFSREPDLELLAARCMEKTPLYHSTFSQTINKRTYTFFINDPFVYFSIYNEDLPKNEALLFLDRIKFAFQDQIGSRKLKDVGRLESHCFQRQFASVVQDILALKLDLTPLNCSRNSSFDSGSDSGLSKSPLLDNSRKGLTEERGLPGKASNGNCKDAKKDVCNNWHCLSDEVFMSVNRVSSPRSTHLNDLLLAKKIWKRHVALVLLLDFFACAVMFWIWLLVCGGLECLNN